MSEQLRHNEPVLHDEAEQDLMVLIKKIQQQLVSLEKKVDTLLNLSQARPSRDGRFSKPFRPFSPSHRRPDREYSRPSGERSFGRERPFERSRSEESRGGFGYKKKSYGGSQGSDFAPRHSFKKRSGGERKSFGREKPFAYKPRERR